MKQLAGVRARCLEAVLDLLWRQWCSLGVAGHARAANPERIIDPEALLLATTSLGREDPRLFDEALDWLAQFGGLINLQRVKNLHRMTGLGDARVLGAVADLLATTAGQPKWRVLAGKSARAGDIRPLFDGMAGRKSDPVFLAHGLSRGPVTLRGLSRPPNPTAPPNVLLALRALIGVSARAETILCLAGGAALKASEIAHRTGYTARTLQLLLQEMTLSGHVITHEPPARATTAGKRGRQRRYLIRPDDWQFLNEGQPLAEWRPWAAVLVFVQEVIERLPLSDQPAKHPAVVSSQLRDLLTERAPDLALSGVLVDLDFRSSSSGEELVRVLVERLPRALNES
ncbi:MAG TPA: hypothetical protein VG796_15830 [Verrucomicrobiales bacterium]|nr:hypothetical protein [Verrucomicrobiales bacterium]